MVGRFTFVSFPKETVTGPARALTRLTYEYLQYLYADHNSGFGHKALYKQGDAKYQKAVAAEKKDQERYEGFAFTANPFPPFCPTLLT